MKNTHAEGFGHAAELHCPRVPTESKHACMLISLPVHAHNSMCIYSLQSMGVCMCVCVSVHYVCKL